MKGPTLKKIAAPLIALLRTIDPKLGDYDVIAVYCHRCDKREEIPTVRLIAIYGIAKPLRSLESEFRKNCGRFDCLLDIVDLSASGIYR